MNRFILLGLHFHDFTFHLDNFPFQQICPFETRSPPGMHCYSDCHMFFLLGDYFWVNSDYVFTGYTLNSQYHAEFNINKCSNLQTVDL